MKKSILNLVGIQKLSKVQQKSINGSGDRVCRTICGSTGGVIDKRFPNQCICY